jgi:hypothetical protein
MTEIDNPNIKRLLDELSNCMLHETPLPQDFYDELQENPDYGIDILRLFPSFDEQETNEKLFMAAFHFIELCLVHLRIASDHNQPWADKLLALYQEELANLMDEHQTQSCWMPIINLFFSADIPLSERVKAIYMQILEKNQQMEQDLNSQQVFMKELLSNDSGSTEFEIAELFFAQTSALPKDYFPAFMSELLTFKEEKAINTAVLFLLHPDIAVRQTLLSYSSELFQQVDLTPASISRLPIIRQWLPDEEKPYIDNLLLSQRKKGIPFARHEKRKIIDIKATEMDGSGAQAIFFLIKQKSHFQATGLLIKRDFGIKDTWISPPLDKEKAKNYATQGIGRDIILRKVDAHYVEALVAHHLYTGQIKGAVPNVMLLCLQEMIGLNWQANPLNIEATMNTLASSFSIDKTWVEKSLVRTGKWYKNKKFTESWFDESPELDKLVNTHCYYRNGTKYCELEDALTDVLTHYLEPKRAQWLEHFIWMALWAKPHARHNEYLWKDCYVLAKLLLEGHPLKEIPLMLSICEQNILASVETMEYRKTHLS